MNTEKEKNNKTKVKLGAITGIIILFSIPFIFFDYFLKKIAFRNTQIAANTALPSKLINIDTNNLNKSNIGTVITEGSFVDQIIYEHRNHDNEEDLFIIGKNSKKLVWIFGDSWGEGIKNDEKKYGLIKNKLQKYDSPSIRVISTSSYGSLLHNLAYRDRLKTHKETPDIVILFFDQTDIGDDYCRYRPYVFRDTSDKLLGVARENNLGIRPGKHTLAQYKLFTENRSGINYLLINAAHKFVLNKTRVPGFNQCNYHDLMAFQKGEKFSPNGSDVKQYENYFIKSVNDFIKEIKSGKKDINILLFSHDWAQHSLPVNNPNFLPYNINSLLRSIALDNDKTEHIHLNTEKYYPKKSLKEIFLYPKDRFSHLKDYRTLIKVMLENI
jgi:hypothetical protein